jgi:hypothetical protein
MKLATVISAVAFSAVLSASPALATVVLHTLPVGNTLRGKAHSNYSLSSSTAKDVYLFELLSPTGASSLILSDSFVGFSSVTLELLSGFGSLATELESVTFPSMHAGDPLILSDAGLKNGTYTLKVFDTLPAATRESLLCDTDIDPTRGVYLVDFNVLNSPLSVVDRTSAVPEPSTWAMMIFGFCGLAFLARRRAAKTTPRLA